MFNSSLGGEFKNSPSFFFFQKSNFCISLPILVIYFQLFGCYLYVLFFLSFIFFIVSYELGWCLIMVLRMVGHCVATPEPDRPDPVGRSEPTWDA